MDALKALFALIKLLLGDTSGTTTSTVSSGNEPSLGNFKFSGKTGNKADVCKACYQAFRNAGATDAAAKGILANINAESGFKPNILTWDGNNRDTFGISGGLCGFYYYGGLPKLAAHSGWSKAKLDQFNNQVKNSGLPYPRVACSSANRKHIMSKVSEFPFSLEQQLSYLVTTKPFQGVKKMTNASDAAWYWEKEYEKPAKKTDRWAKHGPAILKLLGV